MSSKNYQFEPGRRNALIDLLRGLCLLVMTVDHLPRSLIEKFTWQTFGFFSAAEGFVFLSGLVAGQVYARVAITKGIAEVRQRALRRALVIYLANAGLMTLAILSASLGFASLGPGFQPSWSLWSKTMLCIASPGESEILRMYCVFFLLLPGVFWALMNNRFHYVVAISAALWLAASQGYGTAALPGSGYFDLMSWQLLFVAGIYLGFTPVRKLREFRPRASWTAVSLTVVSIFFVLRHWHLFTGQEASPYFQWLWFWRRTLSLGRLLNFAAFAALIYGFHRSLGALVRTWPGKALAFLGQHSLPVFVWSASATMLAGKWEDGWSAARFLDQLGYSVLLLGSCFIPAWLHAKWRARRREKPDLPSAGRPIFPSFGANVREGAALDDAA